MSSFRRGSFKKILVFMLTVALLTTLFVSTQMSTVSAADSEWTLGTDYKIGDTVMYKGGRYQCMMAHKAIEGWEPDKSPTLWKSVPPPTPTPKPTVTPGGPTPTMVPVPLPVPYGKKMVVGYYPEWGVYQGHNMYNVANIPFDKLTHINYAFATIKSGQIAMFDEWAATGITFGGSWDSPYNGTYGQFKLYKAKYPNTKVLMSVGGWTQSGGFHAAAATQTSRQTFAYSCLDFMRQWGFDGIDIDWEYPCVPRDPDLIDNQNDQGNPAGPEDKHNYTLLLETLRKTFDEAGIDDGKRYLLTIAAAAGYDKIDLTEPELFAKYLDFVNLMTYDMHGAWEQTTNHQSPLYANPKDPGNPEVAQKYTTDWVVKEYLRLGIAKLRMNVGVPYYSRGWAGLQDKGPIPELPGLYAKATKGITDTYGAPGIWDSQGRAAGCNPYYQIKGVMEGGAYKKYRDPVSQVPYLYSESLKQMYTYEDDISLSNKCDYVINNGLGGIMFWELTGDSPSKGSDLTTLINTKFRNLTPPPTQPATPTPTNTNTPTPTPTNVGYKVSGNVSPLHDSLDPNFKAGFKVEVVGTSISTTTNSTGYFELKLPAGAYTLKITKPAYLRRDMNVTVSTTDLQIGSSIAMWAGDFDQDGVINMNDIMEIAKYFNSVKGDSKYNENCDINKEGAVNMADVMIVANYFNKKTTDYPM